MKYCSQCGAEVVVTVPEHDNRERYVCPSCEVIHYQNPKIVAGCIPVWEDKVLLCRRAIEPRHGLWTLPAGFMELGETTLEAAVRETLEEANARVDVQDLYMVINLPHVDQVYMMFRSRLLDTDFSPGPESQDVDLFGAGEIPWDSLAFATIRETLRYYFRDKGEGGFRTRAGDIHRDENGYRFILQSDGGE
jgi:ADP-ribose pyrophosphatase YjhB (NUDIX family)